MVKENKARSKELNMACLDTSTVSENPNERIVLRLYIAGLTLRSTLAVERIRSICDRFLEGRYELTVIDLFLHPEMARQAQIIVAPTLVKQSPSPKRLFIGDMADEKRILQGLSIGN